jgi:F-type H+-transporting ATPase subunit gamma
MSSAADLQSVVRTMKALAASSIGQYEKSVRALADYYRTIELGLCACVRQNHPAAADMEDAEAPVHASAISAIVFGSDQGLVGQFNDVVADYTINALGALPGTCRVWAVGQRVHTRLADAGLPLAGLFAVPNSVQAITPLVGQIQIASEAHRDNAEDAPLWVFHNRPLSGALYEPVGQRLLPLDARWQQGLARIHWPTINLPEVMGAGVATLRALVREYLFISLFRACAESLASENASRLAAMERADRNINDLLEQPDSRRSGRSQSAQLRSRMRHGTLHHLQRGNSHARDPLRHRPPAARWFAAPARVSRSPYTHEASICGTISLPG